MYKDNFRSDLFLTLSLNQSGSNIIKIYVRENNAQ